MTIGLPVKNNADTLGLCLSSIFLQTYSDWNLIIVDDGSTDDIHWLLKRISDCDRITIVCDGQSLGLATRLNQIASMCSTEYLFRMDADDIMMPDRIEKQVNFLDQRNCDVIGGYGVSVDQELDVVGLRKSSTDKTIYDILRRNDMFIHPSVCGRTEWFVRNKYDSTYMRAQDLELWTRVMGSSRFCTLEEPVVFYRDSGVFNGQKYRSNQYFIRKLVSRSAAAGCISMSEAILLYARSFANTFILQLLDLFGLYSVFVFKRRNSTLDNKMLYEDKLRVISKWGEENGFIR